MLIMNSKLLIIVFLLFFSFNRLFSQNEIFCGVTDMDITEYHAILNGIGPTPSGLGSVAFEIPLWFYVVREATPGFLGYSGWEAEFTPTQMLNEINGFYSSTGIQFYLCGITQIFSDTYIELDIPTEGAGLRNLAQSLNPNYSEVLNVFLLTKITSGGQDWGGFNQIPNSGDVGSIYNKHVGSQGARTIAHEIGHYFMLPHTFAWGPRVTDIAQPWLAQYVDDEVTFDINGTHITKDCYETGDGFCDTPADPTRFNIGSYCGFGNNCDQPVCPTYPNDPFGVPYSPDGTLLMGYSNGCGNRFSNEQGNQMVSVLFHPDWEFLTDANKPNCQSINSSDRGFVLRSCGAPTAVNVKPFVGFFVPFEDENSAQCGSIVSTDDAGRFLTFDCVYPYDGNGLLSILPETDHADPLAGVTVVDIMRISEHILGIEPLENSFALLAADANNSGSVTTTDQVELRKIILGIYTELPNNSNWRFIPDYCFNDPAFTATFESNPFLATWTNPDEPVATPPNSNERVYGSGTLPIPPNNTSWMDHVSINPDGSGAQTPDAWSFWGIKIGDVDCSARLDGLIPEDSDDGFITIPHAFLVSNQTFTVQLKVVGSTPISAWQMGIEFAKDSLEILQIQPGNSGEYFSLDNFGLTEVSSGKIKAINYSETGSSANLNDKILFKIVLRTLKPISNIGQQFKLKNTVLRNKIYSTDGEETGNINFQLNVQQGSSLISDEYDKDRKHTSAKSYSLSTYPIPFSSEITFDFKLPEESQVQLSIYNNLGHLVFGKIEELTKGYQSITLNQLEDLPSGLYWYSFDTGNDILFGKISKN